MKILAIDLGDVRTGAAVCDPGEMLASPLCVIEQRSRDKLARRISDIAAEHAVGEIVMGYPKNMDGSEGSRAQIYADFAEKLRKTSGLPVVLRDERCTTLIAHTMLNTTDTRGKKRKAVIDAVSATVILQDYLDFRRNREKR